LQFAFQRCIFATHKIKMPKYSKKISAQICSELFKKFDIQHIIISPGSRNAAFTIQFTQDNFFKTYSIIDERSAAFVALGMAKQLQKPVVICCTSGSAAANYYPAITEAFYQNIPLIILTADRPETYIDNFDGQTIRQKNLFELHSVGNYQLSEYETDEAITENFLTVKKAISISLEKQAPVHINVPFSEPLYEQTDEKLFTIDEIKLPTIKYEIPNFITLAEKWNSSSKKIILCGVLTKSDALLNILQKINEDNSVVIFTETTSNLYDSNFFSEIDKLIYSFSEKDFKILQPDLLLTIGQNVVSKKIKDFLRQAKPKYHFHLDEFWQPDTYFCLTDSIKYPKIEFLEEFSTYIQTSESKYFDSWKHLKIQKDEHYKKYVQNISFSDLKIFDILSSQIPENTAIHFSNSSPIRYSQLFDFNSKYEIYCNRGVSGIDGCTSTAIGSAMISEKPTLLITGDIGFFYDSNALWNKYIPDKFKIILLNNGGGDIFKIIPGPDSTDALDEFFVTKHKRNAKLMAEMYCFNYFYADNLSDFNQNLDSFFLSTSNSIFEINTSECENAEILRKFFV